MKDDERKHNLVYILKTKKKERMKSMKVMKRGMAMLATLSLVAGIAMVPTQSADAAKKKTKSTKAKAVKVSAPYAKKAYIAKGKKVKLSANQKVAYKSKNKKVVTVTSKGVIKGKKVGTAKIVVISKKNKKKKVTITVKVMKNAVKKVKMNKKKVSLKAGATLKLKATVSAKKGASKRVYWKSANASVASVSQKGVVKAKKAGVTTITVQATDGSKKKATCKVNVTGGTPGDALNQKPAVVADDIVNLEIKNSDSFTFTLNSPHVLLADSIIVMKKKYAEGTYRQRAKIHTIYSTDDLNYTVVLKNDSILQDGQYIQLTIPEVTGVNVKEIQYMKPIQEPVRENIYKGVVGSKSEEWIQFGEAKGELNYTVSGLPEGITSTTKNGYLVLKGIPTKAGVTVATVNAVDELGNTFTERSIFCIGSNEVLAAVALSDNDNIGEDGYAYCSTQIVVSGGSDSYNYTVISEETAAGSLSSDGALTRNYKDPGTHVVKIQVTDANYPTLTTTVDVVFEVVQGFKLSGKVIDAEGNPMYGQKCRLKFTNTDPNAKGTKSVTISTDAGIANWHVMIPAGVWDIEVQDPNYNTKAYIYSKVINKDEEFNVTLPVYKVLFVESENATGITKSYGYWYDEEGEYMGLGATFYLQSGTYNWNTVDEGVGQKYVANFVVGRAAMKAVVKPVE